MRKRLEAALQVRDAALKKVRAEGEWEETDIGPMLMWKGMRLTMSHRTPFNKLPHIPEHIKYFAAKTGCSPGNLDYGLDIWFNDKKVLNIEWVDSERVDLVSFRRGDWEREVLAFERHCQRKIS